MSNTTISHDVYIKSYFLSTSVENSKMTGILTDHATVPVASIANLEERSLFLAYFSHIICPVKLKLTQKVPSLLINDHTQVLNPSQG
jgi:hypothetical protein